MSTNTTGRIAIEHDVDLINPFLRRSIEFVDNVLNAFVDPYTNELDRKSIRDMLLDSVDDILAQFDQNGKIVLDKMQQFSSGRLCKNRFKADYVASVMTKIARGEDVPIQYPEELAVEVSIVTLKTQIQSILSTFSDSAKAEIHEFHLSLLENLEILNFPLEVCRSIQLVLNTQELTSVKKIDKVIQVINENLHLINIDPKKLPKKSKKEDMA